MKMVAIATMVELLLLAQLENSFITPMDPPLQWRHVISVFTVVMVTNLDDLPWQQHCIINKRRMTCSIYDMYMNRSHLHSPLNFLCPRCKFVFVFVYVLFLIFYRPHAFIVLWTLFSTVEKVIFCEVEYHVYSN